MSIYFFVAIIAFVCVLGFFNEKVTKLPYEISLMLFSTVIGILIIIASALFSGSEILEQAQMMDIKDFLLEGVLCFMLFSGSCRMKLEDFKAQAPATGILSKFGLPKKISFLIEGESLFNDGVGVALFVCFSGMVTSSSSGSFFGIMLKEIAGAVLVGAAVTVLCFLMFRFTKSKMLRIFISMLAVSLSYAICEKCDFSGAIASVVCGILFSALRSRYSEEEPEAVQTFDSFWETLDSLLNSILYVMLGLSFVRILQMEYVVTLALVAISANFIARRSIC